MKILDNNYTLLIVIACFLLIIIIGLSILKYKCLSTVEKNREFYNKIVLPYSKVKRSFDDTNFSSSYLIEIFKCIYENV